jgi:hypothetical protein
MHTNYYGIEMDKLIFSQIANQIINNIEGGYYNPDWHYKTAMGDSGETMFGIDRKHGGTLNTSSAGKEFWEIIDKNKSKDKWFHGYMGGQLESTLKSKVANIMYPYFLELSKKIYPDLLKIVINDTRLLFHFIYASWNGPGFFEFYANKMNALFSKGETNPDRLWQNALALRKTSQWKVIRRSGEIMEKIFRNFKKGSGVVELPEYVVKGKKKNNLYWLIIALLGGIYYAKKKHLI